MTRRFSWIYFLSMVLGVHAMIAQLSDGRSRWKRNSATNTSLLNGTSNVSSTYIITGSSSLMASIQSSQWNTHTSTMIIPTTRIPFPWSILSPYNPDNCVVQNYSRLFNGTCVPKYLAQQIAVTILRNSFINATDVMQGLSLYISAITNSTALKNTSNIISAEMIDDLLDSLSGLNLTISANTSFLTVQNPLIENDITVLGASFKRGVGGGIIDTNNRDNITRTFVSAAGMVTRASLNGVVSLNLFIIDKPSGYENIGNSTNKILASSVVVASIQRNSSTYIPISILLYFNPLSEYKRIGPGTYLCSFFDTNSSEWSESGCSDAYYNDHYHRYECNCSHLTSFALIWLPQSSHTPPSNTTAIFLLDPQDIASLVFQSLSIVCFLAIMTHAIAIRFFDTSHQVPTLKLLPLVSTASTTILFLFFIALGATVRIQTPSPNESECFLSSNVLMFITYFFVIFMFCAKTSTGYFYYLRFVRLFPHTSHRQLFLMLTISFLISLTCVLLAIGLNTNPSISITRLYPYKLCWFTRDVIYYFLTIPVGVFLLLNIVTITLVARSIITHAFHAGSREQISERLKRCVLILLSSCITQGLGWFFGPFITFANPVAGNILAWFFILVNGLEGFWSIILYTLIRLQHIHEEKHVSSTIKRNESAQRCSSIEKTSPIRKTFGVQPWYISNDVRKREIDVIEQLESLD